MSLTALNTPDQRALWRSVAILERETFVGRLTELSGEPITRVMRRLPNAVNRQINRAVQAALYKSLEAALRTSSARFPEPDPAVFKVISMVTGGVGGFLGMATLTVELPVTTTLMLRSIVGIARREGEDLKDPSARLACIEVFALAPHGHGRVSDAVSAETSYYATRTFLAKAVSEAAEALSQRTLAQGSGPLIVELVSAVATRFGMVVSERLAASAIPIVGAIGGAAVNLAFMEHFQQLARAHFTIRRLERVYGAAEVTRVHKAFGPMVRDRFRNKKAQRTLADAAPNRATLPRP